MVTFDLDVLGAAELMASKTPLKELTTELGKAGLAIHAHVSKPAQGTVAPAEATRAMPCKRSTERMVTEVNPRTATGVDHCEISIQGHSTTTSVASFCVHPGSDTARRNRQAAASVQEVNERFAAVTEAGGEFMASRDANVHPHENGAGNELRGMSFKLRPVDVPHELSNGGLHDLATECLGINPVPTRAELRPDPEARQWKAVRCAVMRERAVLPRSCPCLSPCPPACHWSERGDVMGQRVQVRPCDHAPHFDWAGWNDTELLLPRGKSKRMNTLDVGQVTQLQWAEFQTNAEEDEAMKSMSEKAKAAAGFDAKVAMMHEGFDAVRMKAMGTFQLQQREGASISEEEEASNQMELPLNVARLMQLSKDAAKLRHSLVEKGKAKVARKQGHEFVAKTWRQLQSLASNVSSDSLTAVKPDAHSETRHEREAM